MKRYKFECVHADTCLPDYWGGHHLPHVSFPVMTGMSLRDIKRAILDELWQGAIAGNTEEAQLLTCDRTKDPEKADRVFKAAVAAVNRIKPAKKGQRKFFTDIEVDEDADYSVYAYFVFVLED